MSKPFTPPSFSWSFLHPKYWHTWFGIMFMYLLSWLPYRMQVFLGKHLGLLIMQVMKSRKNIVERNLTLCFPEMTEQECAQLTRQNFENMGIGVFETCMAWFWPDWRVKKHVKFIGTEDIDALLQGKGMLLNAIHSFNLELGARAFALIKPGYGVYRPNSNPVYDWFQYRGRTHTNKLIDRSDLKSMFNVLKHGHLLWYAPDHDYGIRSSVWAPLFAVEKACTTTGSYMLASRTRCKVAMFGFTRDKTGTGYTINLSKPMEDFPCQDARLSAIYLNKRIEKAIMVAPEQYMWLHRRFKTRPEGEPSLY